MSDSKRIAKVVSVHELVEGAEFDLEEFQVSASGPSVKNPGENAIFMVNMKIECEKKVEGYNIKPGMWRITPEMGLQPLEMPEVKFYETETSKTLLKNFDNFISKLHVYEKYGITKKRGILLGSDPGVGKCLAKGTKVLMFDGSTKNVEDITEGEQVMGPDSTPRNVSGVISGSEEMFDIIPVKGDKWNCNKSHILSLQANGKTGGYKSGSIVNLNLESYNQLSKSNKSRLKLYRTGISFLEQNTTVDPYLMGVWLGDGSSSKPVIHNTDEKIINSVLSIVKDMEHSSSICCGDKGKCPAINISNNYKTNLLRESMKKSMTTGEKRIPREFLINSKEKRLELLAGLIDTDGSLSNGCFDIITKFDGLNEDILFLARSLGFAAYSKKCKKGIKSRNFVGIYNRITISGDINQVPTKLDRKQADPRKQVKSVLRTGFSIKPTGVGEYYGFQLDKDGLFVLGDFTVTHNTATCNYFARKLQNQKDICFLRIDSSQVAWETIITMFMDAKPTDAKLVVLVIEDIGGTGLEGQDTGRVTPQLLNFLDGNVDAFKIPTLIIGTTNYLDNVGEVLNNRPGRFDVVMQVKPPSDEETVWIVEQFIKRDLTGAEKKVFKGKNLTPAYAKEVVVRSELNDITLEAAVAEITEQRKKAEKRSHTAARTGNVGFGGGYND